MNKVNEWRLFEAVERGDVDEVKQAVKSGLSLVHFTAMTDEMGVLDVAYVTKNRSPQRAKIWNMLKTERKRLIQEKLMPVLDMALVSLNKQGEDCRYRMPNGFKQQLGMIAKSLSYTRETDEWRPDTLETFQIMVNRLKNEMTSQTEGRDCVSIEELSLLNTFAESYIDEASRIRSIEKGQSPADTYLRPLYMSDMFGVSKDLFENVYCLNVDWVEKAVQDGLTFKDFVKDFNGATIMHWAYDARDLAYAERDKEGLKKANQVVKLLEGAQSRSFQKEVAPVLMKISPFFEKKTPAQLPDDTNEQLERLANAYSKFLGNKISPFEALVRAVYQMQYAVVHHELSACPLEIFGALNDVVEAVKRDDAELISPSKRKKIAAKQKASQRRKLQNDGRSM